MAYQRPNTPRPLIYSDSCKPEPIPQWLADQLDADHIQHVRKNMNAGMQHGDTLKEGETLLDQFEHEDRMRTCDSVPGWITEMRLNPNGLH
jgi:hypothetical protein